MSEGNEKIESELILGVFTPHKPIVSSDPRLLIKNGGWFTNREAIRRVARTGEFGWYRVNKMRQYMILPEDLEKALIGSRAKFEPLR